MRIERTAELSSLAEGKPIATQPVIADALQVIQCLGVVRDGHATSDQLIELFLVAFPGFQIGLGHESRQAIKNDKAPNVPESTTGSVFRACRMPG